MFKYDGASDSIPTADVASFVIKSGSLSDYGLTLNKKTGVISGTPTAAGESEVTITVTAKNGNSTDITVTLTVNQATLDESDFDVNTEAETYTGSKITKTIESDLTEDIDYTVAYADNVNAGTAKITITGEGNYSETIEKEFTISPKSASITVNDISKIYGESDPELTGTVSKLISENDLGTVTYSREDGDNVGTYTITAKYTENANYSVEVTKGAFTITEATPTITLAGTSTTYTGEAIKIGDAKVTLVNNEEYKGNITYTYYTDEDCTIETTTANSGAASDGAAPVNVGTYYVIASIAEQDNYTAAESEIAKLTIQEVDFSLTVDGYTGTYDGEAHTVTVTADDGITVTYSTDDNSYSETKPTFTDVGTYTVYYKATKANYNDVTGSVDVVISKADQDISFADSTVTKTVGGDAFTNELQGETAGTITYASSNEKVATVNEDGEVTIVGVGTATITATVSGDDNYNETTVSYTVSVEEGTSYESKIITEELAEKHITDGLSNAGYDTVEKIKNELMRVLITNTNYSEKNSVTYDVSLQISVDGGAWQDATEMNYPTSGLTVTLPYPEGTNKDDYDFRVVHMFTTTSTRLGTTAGGTETPAVTKTDDGIQVTLNGLSPVTVGWTEVTDSSSSADSSSQTGDNTNMVLWIAILLAAAAVGGTAIGSRRLFHRK